MNIPHPTGTCAAEILDVVPLVMRTIKREMRQRRASGLSVPQFRAMIFIDRQGQVALVQVAGHLGLTSATTCRMMDELVARQLVLSRPSTVDRRKITLTLTRQGQAVLENARQGTLKRLEELMAGLSGEENATILQAMDALRRVFASTTDSAGIVNNSADTASLAPDAGTPAAPLSQDAGPKRVRGPAESRP